MEWSVPHMGSRKCFVAVVVFIVGWDDPNSGEQVRFRGNNNWHK